LEAMITCEMMPRPLSSSRFITLYSDGSAHQQDYRSTVWIVFIPATSMICDANVDGVLLQNASALNNRRGKVYDTTSATSDRICMFWPLRLHLNLRPTFTMYCCRLSALVAGPQFLPRPWTEARGLGGNDRL
jgi:hypothetical protein